MVNELIQTFKIHLEEDGESPKTIKSYVGDTTVFVEFLEGKEVDFNGEMKRFYITSYMFFDVDSDASGVVSLNGTSSSEKTFMQQSGIVGSCSISHSLIPWWNLPQIRAARNLRMF